MGHSKRPLPVREDLWQPEDRILDNIIRRSLDEAESDESREGGSTLMAGAMVLAVFGAAILKFAGSVPAAILVPLVLGGAGLAYMVAKSSTTPRGTRHGALLELGGPGRLPAGYLVHAGAWEAGMAEHVAYLPESQLQASVRMCRNFPGTVDDLILFTGSIAIRVPAMQHATPADVERRTKDLVKVGAPILREYLANHPPQALPASGAKNGKKK